MGKSNILFSPFIAYCITFSVALLVYLLNWSYLYPNLSWVLLVFFLATFTISLITAFFFRPFKIFTYKRQTSEVSGYIILFLVAGYVLEFAYSRTIPFLSIASGLSTYEETRVDFGIPTFHVILVGYTAFGSVFYYHSYITQKKRKYLIPFIITLILPLLIMSRITITFIVISCFYIYLMSIRRKVFQKLLKITAFCMLFLFGFGLLGNIRTAADVSADDVFLAIGDARDSFRESWVPKSFFWAYIYISSPIANLQLTMNEPVYNPSSQTGVKDFLIHEFFWDSISKRYDKAKNAKPVSFTQINDAFNVGSIFARSYIYMGVPGIYLMYLFIWVVSIIFTLQLNTESKYYVTYMATFNALIFLCVFDNMLTFTPFSIIGIAFPWVEKVALLFKKRIQHKNGS